jgi:hypothetical protein
LALHSQEDFEAEAEGKRGGTGRNTEAKHRKTTWRTPDAAVAFPPSAKRIQINTRGKIRSRRWNESERNEQKAKKRRLEVRKKGGGKNTKPSWEHKVPSV